MPKFDVENSATKQHIVDKYSKEMVKELVGDYEASHVINKILGQLENNEGRGCVAFQL